VPRLVALVCLSVVVSVADLMDNPNVWDEERFNYGRSWARDGIAEMWSGGVEFEELTQEVANAVAQAIGKPVMMTVVMAGIVET
jgi:hypothetical protein